VITFFKGLFYLSLKIVIIFLQLANSCNFQSIILMSCFASGIMMVEIVWLVLGVMWLTYHYTDCPIEGAKEAILGMEQHSQCTNIQYFVHKVLA